MANLKLLSDSSIFQTAQTEDTQALVAAVNALNSTLSAALALKANSSDFATLSNLVGTKANQTDLTSLSILVPRYGLVTSTAVFALTPLTRYGLKTSAGALSLRLPLLNSLSANCWIELNDFDFNAGNNNVTITASGNDQISLYGVSASSHTMSVNGSRCLLMTDGTVWSMVV